MNHHSLIGGAPPRFFYSREEVARRAVELAGTDAVIMGSFFLYSGNPRDAFTDPEDGWQYLPTQDGDRWKIRVLDETGELVGYWRE